MTAAAAAVTPPLATRCGSPRISSSAETIASLLASSATGPCRSRCTSMTPAPTTIAMTSAMVSTMAERRRVATIRARSRRPLPLRCRLERPRFRPRRLPSPLPRAARKSARRARMTCIGKLPIPPALKEEPVNSAPRGCHKLPCPGAHTRTCGAIWAYVLGPIPSTSCSSSIRLNRPCCCRHVRMAPAVTGPIPAAPRAAPGWRGSDRVSPSLRGRCPRPTRVHLALPRRIAGGTDHHLLAVGKRLCQVQLTRVGSPVSPPAASIASWTREFSGSLTSPG